MKTTMMIASLIFFLSSNILFAATDLESPGVATTATSDINLKILAPVTPKEATFDDDVLTENTFSTRINQQSTAPFKAVFDETLPNELSLKDLIRLLSPSTPSKVDTFEQLLELNRTWIPGPVTPKEAAFEEIK